MCQFAKCRSPCLFFQYHLYPAIDYVSHRDPSCLSLSIECFRGALSAHDVFATSPATLIVLHRPPTAALLALSRLSAAFTACPWQEEERQSSPDIACSSYARRSVMGKERCYCANPNRSGMPTMMSPRFPTKHTSRDMSEDIHSLSTPPKCILHYNKQTKG